MAIGSMAVVEQDDAYYHPQVDSEKTITHLAKASTIDDGRFEIVKRLGSGSFGEIFLARDLITNTLCALKVEPSNSKHPQLRIEQKIFQRMNNCQYVMIESVYFSIKISYIGIGYPSMIKLIEERDVIILAMELLGPSLEDLLNFCQRKFSKKTVLMLIDQAIRRIQFMHDRSLIHRDVRISLVIDISFLSSFIHIYACM
jgi:serine/threonine protein kinase